MVSYKFHKPSVICVKKTLRVIWRAQADFVQQGLMFMEPKKAILNQPTLINNSRLLNKHKTPELRHNER